MHQNLLTRVHCRRPLHRVTAFPPSPVTARPVACPASVGPQNSRSQSSALHHQAAPLVEAPPAGFDFRSATATESEQLIGRDFPELLDLAQQGVLIAIRPKGKERRTDGYREPQLVLLVGTVHVSQASAAAVTRVIECAKPENVVVELCRSRTGVMYESDSASEPSTSGRDEAAGLQISSWRRQVQDALNGSGSGVGLLLRGLATSLSARIEAQIGAQIGVDVRAARMAAEKVEAQIVLGDRPIEITMERAWEALSWGSRWQLLRGLLALLSSPAPPSVGAEEIRQLDTDEAVFAVADKLSGSHPAVASALIHERDLYLAWSMKRSKAVNGCRTVVGVIGKGHLPGVVYHLLQDSHNLRFRDLAGTKRRSRPERQQLVPRWIAVLAGNIAFMYGVQALWQYFGTHA